MLVKPLIKPTTMFYSISMTSLCDWYQHQSMYIKWGSTLPIKFQVANGVRQGGVLSPLLFDVYVNELSEPPSKSGIGRNLCGTIINHMLYVDDIYIVFLSSSDLQHLLNICSDTVNDII